MTKTEKNELRKEDLTLSDLVDSTSSELREEDLTLSELVDSTSSGIHDLKDQIEEIVERNEDEDLEEIIDYAMQNAEEATRQIQSVEHRVEEIKKTCLKLIDMTKTEKEEFREKDVTLSELIDSTSCGLHDLKDQFEEIVERNEDEDLEEPIEYAMQKAEEATRQIQTIEHRVEEAKETCLKLAAEFQTNGKAAKW